MASALTLPFVTEAPYAAAPLIFPEPRPDFYELAPLRYDFPAVTLNSLRDVVVRGRSNMLTTPDGVLRHGLVDPLTETAPEDFYGRLTSLEDGGSLSWSCNDPGPKALIRSLRNEIVYGAWRAGGLGGSPDLQPGGGAAVLRAILASQFVSSLDYRGKVAGAAGSGRWKRCAGLSCGLRMAEARQLERSILRKLIAPMLAGLAFAAVAANAQAQAAAAPADGKALFTAKCGICHANTPTGGPVVGPSLYGVVGRKAGSKEGFHYSKALPATGVTWQPAIIDKFISSPTTFAPGTFMPINVPDAGERKLIVGYLATLGAEPAAEEPKAKATTTKKTSSKTTKKS